MIIRLYKALATCCFLAAILFTNTTAYIPNLTESCFRCLCHVATRCQTSLGCSGGYCGPFYISKIYWVDAGKVTLPGDNPNSPDAWERCAQNYNCAKRIIESYLNKFGRDCNNDGVTNCYDYVMINSNGAYGCTRSLGRSANGKQKQKRYKECSRFF